MHVLMHGQKTHMHARVARKRAILDSVPAQFQERGKNLTGRPNKSVFSLGQFCRKNPPGKNPGDGEERRGKGFPGKKDLEKGKLRLGCLILKRGARLTTHSSSQMNAHLHPESL